MERKGNDDAIYRENTDALKGKVAFSKISWYMPRVLPNDQEKLSLIKIIEAKSAINVGFRSHQCDTISVPKGTTFSWRLTVKTSPESPRWVIVGFQKGKSDKQDQNASAFDHCEAKNVWIELNGNSYPSLEYNTDFKKQRIGTLYNALSNFLPNYYGITQSQSNISPMDFISLYPLHVINISKQPERLKYGVMDMNLRATFATAPEGAIAYALIISDRIVTFQSDGRKMNVVI